MVNEIRDNMPPPKPFVWAREYGPLWSGSGDSAFWLEPGPDDVLEIDGIRAPMREHISGEAKRKAQIAHDMRMYSPLGRAAQMQSNYMNSLLGRV